MIDLKGCKVVRSARADELETLTSAGWVLLGFVTEGTFEAVWDQEHVVLPAAAAPPGCYGSGSYTQQVTQQRHRPTTQVVFLLGRDDASALAVQVKRADEAEARYKEWDKKLQEERKAHDVAKSCRDMNERALETSRHCHEEAVKEREEAKALARKLETDIAKIRRSVGEREMQRILTEST